MEGNAWVRRSVGDTYAFYLDSIPTFSYSTKCWMNASQNGTFWGVFGKIMPNGDFQQCVYWKKTTDHCFCGYSRREGLYRVLPRPGPWPWTLMIDEGRMRRFSTRVVISMPRAADQVHIKLNCFSVNCRRGKANMLAVNSRKERRGNVETYDHYITRIEPIQSFPVIWIPTHSIGTMALCKWHSVIFTLQEAN